MFSFGFPPKGWAALFSLLGTTYGGDGLVNFGLPDLQGRLPMHNGNGHTLGERGGEQGHTPDRGGKRVTIYIATFATAVRAAGLLDRVG
jgi:microcystin-dependent protein